MGAQEELCPRLLLGPHITRELMDIATRQTYADISFEATGMIAISVSYRGNQHLVNLHGLRLPIILYQ